MHYIFRSAGHLYTTLKLLTPLAKPFWATGRKLTLPVPSLEFEVEANDTFQWVDFFKATSIPLFSPRLRTALEDCGVDNVDYYPARVRDAKTGEVRDYHAANVIGRVECVDRERSKFQPVADSPVSIASFERLVLDERKIRGLKLFRSAEFGLLLLIDKPVKEHLEAEELSALMFIEPEKWDGFLS
jgi:hypothetical protein